LFSHPDLKVNIINVDNFVYQVVVESNTGEVLSFAPVKAKKCINDSYFEQVSLFADEITKKPACKYFFESEAAWG